MATLTVYLNHCPVAVQPRSYPQPVSVQVSWTHPAHLARAMLHLMQRRCAWPEWLMCLVLAATTKTAITERYRIR